MKEIGLITYHSAYNFGSVLQAYATQETILKIAGNCEVINYRTEEQKKSYSIFQWEKGPGFIKSIIKNFLLLSKFGEKKKRERLYEDFFLNK